MLLKLKWSALALGPACSPLKFFPPSPKPPAPAEPAHSPDVVRVAGPEVGAIVNRACKDCHSNDTAWPWYSHISPVSWMISKHVLQGREKVNFSEWVPGKLTANQKAEICDAVSNGSMPLPGYTILHSNAR